MRADAPRDTKVLSLAGYKSTLHQADVAIITPSTSSYEYMLVDGAIQRMVRSHTPIVVERWPRDFMAAHRALMRAVQHYPVWMLLEAVSYPTWAMATLLQVQGAGEVTRIFLIKGQPFGVREFLLN